VELIALMLHSDAEEKFEFETGVETKALAFPKLYRFR
jgi:hypothetical protein